MGCSGRPLSSPILPFPWGTRKLVNPGISVSVHKYHVGQAVQFFPERGVEHTAKGRFKIVRLLLGEHNAPRYRIKHEIDGHERMVGESELGPR
jgi:hypothetical protein